MTTDEVFRLQIASPELARLGQASLDGRILCVAEPWGLAACLGGADDFVDAVDVFGLQFPFIERLFEGIIGRAFDLPSRGGAQSTSGSRRIRVVVFVVAPEQVSDVPRIPAAAAPAIGWGCRHATAAEVSGFEFLSGLDVFAELFHQLDRFFFFEVDPGRSRSGDLTTQEGGQCCVSELSGHAPRLVWCKLHPFFEGLQHLLVAGVLLNFMFGLLLLEATLLV